MYVNFKNSEKRINRKTKITGKRKQRYISLLERRFKIETIRST